ncbi:MAG: hypothetical protein R3240_09180, partial [Gammaproteobacteria bacterium]|nr:hypothetical protein [Gammaproteobacteria bacterium]
PPEKDVTGQESRIGVFVCHCGANIGSVVNVPSVVEYAWKLPNVIHAQEQLFSCATNSVREITELAEEKSLSTETIEAYKELGQLLNYNGYGVVEADLHFHPAELYQKVSQYDLPEKFLNDPAFTTLKRGFESDYVNAQAITPTLENDKQAIYILPNEKWSARVSGVFANDLNKQYPQRAHAMLTDLGDEHYLVSVRAPAQTKEGADDLCRQFETGGGRKAAAGINRLPFADYALFVERFKAQFS